jgi:hypothetical protein
MRTRTPPGPRGDPARERPARAKLNELFNVFA